VGITERKLLFWAPRVLGLAFAAFLSLFALDVFAQAEQPSQSMIALTIHLIPTAFVLAILAISLRWGGVAGLVFVALGSYYVASTWGRLAWSAYLVITGPMFLLGLLFELDWWYSRHWND
jgi:hypothetical protein